MNNRYTIYTKITNSKTSIFTYLIYILYIMFKGEKAVLCYSACEGVDRILTIDSKIVKLYSETYTTYNITGSDVGNYVCKNVDILDLFHIHAFYHFYKVEHITEDNITKYMIKYPDIFLN